MSLLSRGSPVTKGDLTGATPAPAPQTMQGRGVKLPETATLCVSSSITARRRAKRVALNNEIRMPCKQYNNLLLMDGKTDIFVCTVAAADRVRLKIWHRLGIFGDRVEKKK
ncbi:hypothetical protein E2C01_008063 [Portunus trituberculatus]|uniref:Uncharacterized protein n=1 Tax=Portunus trituberculatus TaxID=210409 RepID=A0A5B7CZT6_PORTR|nr:hypothetical protein [Portunus trituberculatus]